MKKNNKYSLMTIIVITSLTYLVLFTIACLFIVYSGKYEPSALIQWNFTVFGVELALLMVKKILDNKNGGSNNGV